MEFNTIGRTLSNCYKFVMSNNKNLLLHGQNNIFLVRTYAARKGYREQAKKKKVKTVIQKQAWVPHNLRRKDGEESVLVKQSLEHKKRQPVDDVWVAKYYAWRIYSFKEALEFNKETHHPTIYNVSNAPVNLFIELDMTTEKKTKFVDKFHKMAILPHFFEQEGLKERTILAFCKTEEQKDEAMSAGANLVGGVEIIKEIEKGKIVLPDFRFVIAHPNILPEMVTIRGLLKKRFPNIKSGTLGPNVGELVAQFKNGVEYSCLKNNNAPEYGWIDVCIGRLNMDSTKLEENFSKLIQDINLQRPKRQGPFITRIVMSSPPSVEKFKIDLRPYLEEETIADNESSDEEEGMSVKI